ncbi:hypothetical protein [Roseiarcus fermentans]|nr:hypothetical protein [Roseiarcus fermentans]
MNFWFYSAAAAEQFIAGDHDGVTSITYAGQTDPLLNGKIHASGMAVVGGVGGVISLKRTTADEIRNDQSGPLLDSRALERIANTGADAIYVDEPVGPALIGECGPDCYDATRLQATEKGVEFIVAAMNSLGDQFRSKVPGGKFGICVGDGGGVSFHIAALRAGLREDFACYEQFGGAHVHPFEALKKEFPQVATMLLVYNTVALCAGNEIGAFDTWGFWNLDNHPEWVPGPRGDADWLENAKRFARGDTRFCDLPISRVISPLTHARQGVDFQVAPADWLRPHSGLSLGACAYRVVSKDQETVPWRSRACNQPFLVTVGPDKDCRDNGVHTCRVYVRAQASNTEFGDTQYEMFNIAY